MILEISTYKYTIELFKSDVYPYACVVRLVGLTR